MSGTSNVSLSRSRSGGWACQIHLCSCLIERFDAGGKVECDKAVFFQPASASHLPSEWAAFLQPPPEEAS